MKKNKKWVLKNSYLQLPNCFYKKTKPSLVQNPKLVYFNNSLAKYLNLEFLNDDISLISSYFSGNKIPSNSEPLAQAYAGHQFGRFTMLGDGRATLLGEQKDINNKLFDIQLKGSGKTPFSRNGDGRATLSSMMREYLMSESMHYLKIPTTRSLAVIDTGEKVYRETVEKGGVLTRVSSSHIRVGTFEYAKYYCTKEDFQQFINYVVSKYFPEVLNHKSPYLKLLKLVMKKQISLITDWVRVGFIHGVMNTDNMSITGETIDYGPCAFLNKYDPKTVFSSIDRYGRYAFGKQHEIAYWNLSVFAETILAFINTSQDKAIDLVQSILDQFPADYSNKWYGMMYSKLGIINPNKKDEILVVNLLKLMELHKVDYTNTFAALTLNISNNNSLFKSNEFKNWKKKWKERTQNNENSLSMMKMNNPIYIPRNHLVESALKNSINGNLDEFERLLSIMSNTYNYDKNHYKLQSVPEGFDNSYKTFCGT